MRPLRPVAVLAIISFTACAGGASHVTKAVPAGDLTTQSRARSFNAISLPPPRGVAPPSVGAGAGAVVLEPDTAEPDDSDLGVDAVDEVQTQGAAVAHNTACALRPGLGSPIDGPLQVLSPYGAFGALRYEAGKAAFYAHKGADLSYPVLKPVRASHGGTLHLGTQYKDPQHPEQGLTGYGYFAYVIAPGGATQTLYAHLTQFSKAESALDGTNVMQGDQIARSGTSGNAEHGAPHVHFEYSASGTVFSKDRAASYNKINPCGSVSESNGTLNVVPQAASATTHFTSVSVALGASLSGILVPVSESGAPVVLDSLRASITHPVTVNVEQYLDNPSPYYLVACGHIAFERSAGSNPRVAGPFEPGQPAKVKLVAFVDPGKQGQKLVANLPVTGAPCPAPPQVDTTSTTAPVFGAVGQTWESAWCRTDGQSDTVTLTVQDPAIASVAPPSIGVVQHCVPYTLHANYDPHYTVTANGIGETTMTSFSMLAHAQQQPIALKVLATPTPAPIPPALQAPAPPGE